MLPNLAKVRGLDDREGPEKRGGLTERSNDPCSGN
jgi:hypothetical protein